MLACEKLDQAIEVHGGLALWRRLQYLTLRIDSLGGQLSIAKGLGRTFAGPGTVTIYPSRWRVAFGDGATYAAGAVEIGGHVLPRYRETFRGVRKYRRWSQADAVYFFGYALATYFSVPFVLPAFATRVKDWDGGLCVTARFPETVDTHCRDQRFWFDRAGLLVRHDYRADIVGWWAAGAHFTSGYERVDGLAVATRRDVYARVFGVVTPIPVLSARLSIQDLILSADK